MTRTDILAFEETQRISFPAWGSFQAPNEHCLEDLAKEIGKKQQKIEEMKKINDKTVVQKDYVLRKEIKREDANQKQEEEKVEEIELKEEVK